MPKPWTCPECERAFSRANQRHACGTGERSDVLRNRPPALVKLYAAVESFVRGLGRVEFVTRDRYVLLRRLRIFTDLVIMSDAVRIAIHLQRKVDDPRFFKVVTDGRKVTHVAKLKALSDLKAVQPYIREAYELSIERDRRNNL